MKKAIAMRCNQKQFNAIKSKLVGCEIYVITGFCTNPYLVNDFGLNKNVVSNFLTEDKFNYERQFEETWNEQVFLEACGIETEKTFKGSELQWWDSIDNRWLDCQLEKYRLKPDYSAEIAELEKQIQILKNK